jgi:hypothetical protein
MNAGALSSVIADSFYTATDTLENGVAAFSGSGARHSVLHIQNCVGFKTTATLSPCDFPYSKSFYFRFRFVSDSVADSLDGWKIDSIVVHENYCPGMVQELSAGKLQIVPNPSADGAFAFPALAGEELYTVEVYNSIGQKIQSQPYKRQLQIGNGPGLYFYITTNGSNSYSGKLLIR